MINSTIQTTFLDYPDNKSYAVIYFCSGCDNNCNNCQNTNLQTFKEFSKTKIINNIYKLCDRIKTKKIVLSGGDPIYKTNIGFTNELLMIFNKFDICIYTGYDVEYVKKVLSSGFKFLKCGKFDESKFIGSKKTDEYIQFASSNQKLYDKNFNLISKEGVYKF